MVGSRFCELAKRDFDLVEADLAGGLKIDITQKDLVNKFFDDNDFEWVILFSAFTDVDEAEKQRENKNGLCWQINVKGVENIVDACKAHLRKLIFISTDFVFDGENGPYDENSPVGPNLSKVSWYGITKIEAEKLVQNLRESIILRISYPFRANFPPKEDFARNILRLYKENTLYPMFTDQIFTPTFIDDLEPAVLILIKKGLGGIFHLASSRPSTPYQFAQYLLDTFNGFPPDIKEAKLADFLNKKNTTSRPLKGGMIVDKIAKIGFHPTDWQEGIKIIYKQSRGKLI